MNAVTTYRLYNALRALGYKPAAAWLRATR